jgi:A/G-specific adenine glycosylase
MQSSEQAFIQTVKRYYRAHGRHALPWRQTYDPYSIAVSEIMLQQTQVSRVIDAYIRFIKKFPTVQSLARAPLRDVLVLWNGLGYNRRAKFLHQMAQAVVRDHAGIFPETIQGLQSLPGIGPYTAGAIYAFSYNKAFPIVETNIRSVYIHHFFADKDGISDKELYPLIERTLQKRNPRQWYWALMDYGAYLKSTGIKNNAKSKHYAKQSRFEGSRRQVRGQIMRSLVDGPQTDQALLAIAPAARDVLRDLVCEGLITKRGRSYHL